MGDQISFNTIYQQSLKGISTVTLTLEKIEEKTATFSKIIDFGRPCPLLK